MSKPNRPASRADRRDDALDRLLQATTRLLGDDSSFGDLSVERLAAEAGISRATFYLYFEDKAELVRAWYVRMEAEAHAATAAWLEDDGPVDRQRVREALRRSSGLHRERELHAAFNELAHTDAAVRSLRAAGAARSYQGLHAHLLRGQRGGWIDTTLLPDQTAAWLSSMISRVNEAVVPGVDDEALDRLLDAGAEVVWTTLYGPAPELEPV